MGKQESHLPHEEPSALTLSPEHRLLDGDILAEIPAMDGSLWKLVQPRLERNSQTLKHFERLVRKADGNNSFFEPEFTRASLDRVIHGRVDLLVV